MDQNLPSDQKLSHLANLLVTSFEKEEEKKEISHGIHVNRVVSEIATWYEKLRNAMDYREEEVVRRAAIERILKRRLIFGGNGEKIAAPLVRELLWARYFPESLISEGDIARVAHVIDIYLSLREHLIVKQKEVGVKIDTLIYKLLSARLETLLNRNKDIEFISNFIFHLFKEHVTIVDDTAQTRDIQVFIAVRRTFAKYDIAFLRFYLFGQYFGDVNEASIPKIVAHFVPGFKEIERQLHYRLKDRITAYIKRQIPPFLIFGEIIRAERNNMRNLLNNTKEFHDQVFKVAQARYKTISSKVRISIIRAFIFILFTKFIFSFSVEATYDNLFLGGVKWNALLINIVAPPILMALASLFIRTPDKDNTQRIYNRIETVLFTEKPVLDRSLTISLNPPKKNPILDLAFRFLWFAGFISSFGLIFFVLDKLHFSIASEGIFIFFIAIVSFFTYRISQTARSYTVPNKQSLFAPVGDFFFMPVVQIGRRLTDGISQINIFLYLFDYLIETPFKEIFGFLEQWFFFLQTKREELG